VAITKSIEISKIEIVNTWSIGVRTDTVIKEDGIEISRSSHRKVIDPFASSYDNDSSAWIHSATDISEEDVSVQAHCNTAWTDDVKAAFKSQKENNGG
jgi:hypothetical protein